MGGGDGKVYAFHRNGKPVGGFPVLLQDPNQPDDYPDYAHPLAKQVSEGHAKRGILLCGSGVGMDIVANRYPGVRAALAWEPEIGELGHPE